MSNLREDLEELAVHIKPGSTKGRQTSARYYIPELERYIKALMLETYKEARNRYNSQDGVVKHNQMHFFEEVLREL